MNDRAVNIFEYLNFKEFLKDYRDEQRKKDPGFSNPYISVRLGEKNSKSLFNNIVSGRRTVTPLLIDKLLELLELEGNEAKYFRALVSYNQTVSPAEKTYHFDQIVSLNHTPNKLISEEEYEYFSEWHHSVIREILDMESFSGDYKYLAAKLIPPITVAQAKKSVALLKKLGLVTKTKNGNLKSTEKVLIAGKKIQTAIIEQYQIQALERAKKQIAEDPIRQQTLTTTFSASPEALKDIGLRIGRLRKEIRSITHKDDKPNKNVYQIILNTNSLTKLK